ncbi:MAG: ABC transporter ATP-binding protein [Actinobacteria bacterium]|nr:ABC transporter ATP-binding protein [Actinomycetota bacterium]
MLRVSDLRLQTDAGVEIVCGVDFEARAGEILALVGESGCGKTSTALALLGHARVGMGIAGGSVRIGDAEVLATKAGTLRGMRGADVAYVPQDASTSLNPRMQIGRQMEEALRIHGVDSESARSRVRGLIERIGLRDPVRILRSYPFELSGGQQQRVLIAMAVSCEPSVVVLDEPTTGLDVTTQAKVLELVTELAEGSRMAFVYVTHDLAVVDEIADRVAVMYSGRIVEQGDCRDVLGRPQHPYTALLLRSVPRISERRELAGVGGRMTSPDARPSGCSFRLRCPLATDRCAAEFPPVIGERHQIRCWHAGDLEQTAGALLVDATVARDRPAVLEVENLTAGYGRHADARPVVDGISFAIDEGECVALVGESGSGKTTTGRCLTGLHPPISGSVKLHGEVLAPTAPRRTLEQRRALQVVFQNPDRSLNPSHTVAAAIERPLLLFKQTKRGDGRRTVAGLLDRVHLSAKMLDRYPFELSGGEKQRVAIARALAARPELIVCDEITSALDVSIQASIVNLLNELKADGLSMLFITHNLGVVNSIADRTLVMATGTIREEGTTSHILGQPRDAYTKQLLEAAPELRSGSGDNAMVGGEA